MLAAVSPIHNFQSIYASENFADASEILSTVLAESQSFVAIPSVGALVEGWVLIVPKEAYISIGAIPDSLWVELELFINKVKILVEKHYGEVVIFEHGPSQEKSKIGCGVDYAHIHVVPVQFDVLGEATKFAPSLTWRAAYSLKHASQFAREYRPYLFFSQPRFHEVPLIADATFAPSQLFRRAIASTLGMPEKYDWKLHPEFENVRGSVANLR